MGLTLEEGVMMNSFVIRPDKFRDYRKGEKKQKIRTYKKRLKSRKKCNLPSSTIRIFIKK